MKGTISASRCQGRIRIGRVVLSREHLHGEGAALLPVERQQAGGWALTGVLRIAAQELGFRRFPSTRSAKRRMVSRAVKAGYAALGAA